MIRYAGAVLAAAGVTFGLFYLMQYLVGTDQLADVENVATTVIDIGRIQRDSDLEIRQRLPQRTEVKQQPPPPPITAAPAPRPVSDDLDIGAFTINPDVSLVSPDIGDAPSDADTVPLVRVPPQYPPRAQERGIEGWVLVEFSISKAGAVSNVQVVDAKPPNIFNRAAMRAVRKWKYKPKIEDGVPVERHGVRTVITFELET